MSAYLMIIAKLIVILLLPIMTMYTLLMQAFISIKHELAKIWTGKKRKTIDTKMKRRRNK
jgi:hypothetical protein